METKRIFNITVADYLLKRGIELVEIRAGEVKGKPDRPTFLFINNERLTEALNNYRK